METTDYTSAKRKVKNLLYTIYCAGFSHGSNEGDFPEHGTFEAFERLIKGESPLLDKISYGIEDKVQCLIDFEEVNDSKKALIRELDVLLNGEEGASKQASLCDIVSQVRTMLKK